MKVLQGIKLLNRKIPPSTSFILTNRIIKKLTKEILANYRNKRGSARIKVELEFGAHALAWWYHTPSQIDEFNRDIYGKFWRSVY